MPIVPFVWVLPRKEVEVNRIRRARQYWSTLDWDERLAALALVSALVSGVLAIIETATRPWRY